MALLLFAAPLVADELIVLRDGSSRTGEVESCNAQGCRIDGRQIHRDAIAAIVFDRDAKVESATKRLLRTDEVHLRDGKITLGAVRMLTGEEVITVAGDYARDNVRAIFFSPGDPQDQPEILADVLILRDGQRRQGALQLCSQASCLLDQTSTLRAQVEWIGLARGDAAPPQSDSDTVHLVTGEVLEKALISITDDVLTTSARYEREDVAWIHLAPAADEQPPINRFPPAPPEGPVGPPPPPSPLRSSSPPPPRPGGLGTGDPCPASAPMGGYVELTQSGPDIYSIPDCFHRNESRMWFRLVPQPPVLPWPSRWTGIFRAPSVHYRVSMGPCRLTREDGTWVNPGGTARHDVDLGGATGNGSITYLPLSGALSVSLDRGYAVETVTRTGNGGELYTGARFDTFSIDAAGCADHTHAFGFCSNIRPCTETPSAADCIRQPQKYVVFPWEGSDRINPTEGPLINTVVRWKVCCGCGEPPEGGLDPTERGRPDDPCDEIANLERRLAQLRDVRAQFARDLMAAQHRQKTVLLEKILSGQGTVAQTLLALISLLSNAPKLNAVGDAIGTFLDGNSVGDDPSGENIAGAVVGAAGTDVVFDAIAQRDIVNATRDAADHLARTSDADGAVRRLEQSFERSGALRDKAKTVTGALGVIVAAKGLHDKGSQLGDTLQEYFDAGDDVRMNQEGLRDAENQILDVQLELERLERELEDPCAATGRMDRAPFVFPVLSADSDLRLARYPPQIATPPSPTEKAQLTTDLAEVKQLLLEGDAHAAKAVPLMLFFASAEARAAASPELTVAVARALRTRTQAAGAAYGRAAEIARRTADEVGRQNPAALPTATTADASSLWR